MFNQFKHWYVGDSKAMRDVDFLENKFKSEYMNIDFLHPLNSHVLKLICSQQACSMDS